MRHQTIREEKNCLNCGQTVEDRYCSHCGQENVEIRDSALHLLVHYIQDLFHYDGKLWYTLKSLMTRPGQVALEYLNGKRRHFLDPIRFYIFASTVFFLVLFLRIGDTVTLSSGTGGPALKERLYWLEKEKEIREGTSDSVHINALIRSLRDSLSMDSSTGIPVSKDIELDLFHTADDSSGQKGWFEQYYDERMKKKNEELKEKYSGNEWKASSAILDELLHTLPQLFFLSLPFFALFLQILYFRSVRRRYVEHFIFSIYHYAYLFSTFLLLVLLMWVFGKTDWDIPGILLTLLIIFWIFYPMVYLYLSMRRFYADRGWKLIVRYLILLFLFLVSLLFLAYVVALFTIIF